MLCEETEKKQMTTSSTICTEQKSNIIAYALLQKRPYEQKE